MIEAFVGKQDDGTAGGGGHPHAPGRQAAVRERIELRAGGREDQGDGAVGQRADPRKRRGPRDGFGQGHGQGLLAGPSDRRHVPDHDRLRALQQHEEQG